MSKNIGRQMEMLEVLVMVAGGKGGNAVAYATFAALDSRPFHSNRLGHASQHG
jgi:hypothetical protein